MFICDLHCDTVYRIGDEKLYSIKDSHLDLERMIKSQYALGTFAAFVNMGSCPCPWEKCLSLLSTLRRETERYSSILAPVLRKEDPALNMEKGKMSILYSVEEGGVIGDSLSRIDVLYELGVRMMTLTWNYKNSLASPAFDCSSNAPMSCSCGYNESDGLTPLGFEAVRMLDEKRMIIDVSHLSDKGFHDIAEASRRPFIASHSNTRSIQPVKRNLTDDMIRIIGKRGGLIGLNYCSEFIGGEGGFETLARHARRIREKGGVECLALGSDFDGIEYNPFIPDCTAVPLFPEYLERADFTDDEIDLIMGKNVLRFLSENL